LARGDLVTVAAGGGYGGKPRPAVVIQADEYSVSESITFCLITSIYIDAPATRIEIEPSEENGLRRTSWIMADKIMTLTRRGVGRKIGRLNVRDMERLDEAILLFLGLAQ